MNMIEIIKKIKNDDLKRSMLLSFVCRPIGMLISLAYTPLLLRYLGNEKFGLWATILSVINWINFFDIGIGNGLRNLLSIEILENKKSKIQESVSTAYRVISTISICLVCMGCFMIVFFDTSKVFNTTVNIKPVVLISFIFICISFVLSLGKTILFAIQKSEVTSFIGIVTQFINLLGIIILLSVSKGSLITVSILVGCSTLVVNLILHGVLWKKKPYFIPKFSYYRKDKLKQICSVGIKFFIIQIAALVLYTTDNLIISHYFGAKDVTPYNTTRTAFSVVYSFFSALMVPLWSQYTVAVSQNRYDWIRRSIIKLDCLLLPIGITLGIASIYWKKVSYIWLGRELHYPSGLIICMAIYFLLNCWNQIYATVSNGMGFVNMQLALGVGTAIINIPLCVYLGRDLGMGSTGVLLATVICMFIAIIPLTVSVHVFLNRKITESSVDKFTTEQ